MLKKNTSTFKFIFYIWSYKQLNQSFLSKFTLLKYIYSLVHINLFFLKNFNFFKSKLIFNKITKQVNNINFNNLI